MLNHGLNIEMGELGYWSFRSFLEDAVELLTSSFRTRLPGWS
jgi:hypothetical protein